MEIERKQTLVFLLFGSINVPLFLFISLLLFHLLGSNYRHHNNLLLYDNHVVVFFIFNFIIFTIFLGTPNKPPSSGSDSDYWSCSLPLSSVHEACDTKDNENINEEAYSYGNEQSWDLCVFHGYDQDNHEDEDEDEDDCSEGDGNGEEEEDKELERKIEEFIAKVHRERRDELQKDQASL